MTKIIETHAGIPDFVKKDIEMDIKKPVKKPIKLDQTVFSLVTFFIATILLTVVSYKAGVNDGMDESERHFKKVLKKMTVVQNKCVNVPTYDCYPIKEYN